MYVKRVSHAFEDFMISSGTRSFTRVSGHTFALNVDVGLRVVMLLLDIIKVKEGVLAVEPAWEAMRQRMITARVASPPGPKMAWMVLSLQSPSVWTKRMSGGSTCRVSRNMMHPQIRCRAPIPSIATSRASRVHTRPSPLAGPLPGAFSRHPPAMLAPAPRHLPPPRLET